MATPQTSASTVNRATGIAIAISKTTSKTKSRARTKAITIVGLRARARQITTATLTGTLTETATKTVTATLSSITKELSLTCLTSQSHEFSGQHDSNTFVPAKLFPDGQRSRGRDPGKVGRPVIARVLLRPLDLDGQRLGRKENSELDPVD